MLPPGVPELVDLDLLLCVERLGSLSKAAREHSVSQPAASVRIQAVERRLGLQLLERSPTGCQLTSAGRMVTQWARDVVDAAAELATRTTTLRDAQRGQLHVAASLTVADHLMPAWLIALREQLPHVAVVLQVQNSRRVIEQLSSGQIVLGFVEGPCPHAELTQVVVGHDELAVVVAPSHPWAQRVTPVAPSELLARPLAMREPGSGTRETLEQALGGLSDSGPHLELGSTNAIKAAVADGTGAAVLSLRTVQGEIRDGQLARVSVSGVHLVRELRAAWNAREDLPSPAQTLVKIASRHAPAGVPRKSGQNSPGLVSCDPIRQEKFSPAAAVQREYRPAATA